MEKINGRLLQLEMDKMRLMDEMEKLREKMNQEMKELKEELEEKLSGHKDKVRAKGEEPAGSSSRGLKGPARNKLFAGGPKIAWGARFLDRASWNNVSR